MSKMADSSSMQFFQETKKSSIPNQGNTQTQPASFFSSRLFGKDIINVTHTQNQNNDGNTSLLANSKIPQRFPHSNSIVEEEKQPQTQQVESQNLPFTKSQSQQLPPPQPLTKYSSNTTNATINSSKMAMVVEPSAVANQKSTLTNTTTATEQPKSTLPLAKTSNSLEIFDPNSTNPQMVTPYANEIFDYLRQVEVTSSLSVT